MTNLILLLTVLLPSILTQTFTIIGNVRDQSGQFVSSVRVAVYDENFQPIRTLFVDGSGRFQIQGLRTGRYQFRVETTGTPYEEQTQTHDLQAVRIRGTGSEPYLIEFILKFKKWKEASTKSGTVFAQPVPEAARAEYERGSNSLKNDKPEPGIAALKKAIEIFPDYYDALELLGTEYVKRGEFNLAAPILTHALEVNRRAPKSLYALGVAYLKLNRFAESVELLQKAAEQDPSNANVYMMLGLASGNNRALDQAEAAFKKALQLSGANVAEAHFYLAGIFNKQERYHEAWRELELYLKEAKDIKDREQVRSMIEKLKAKDKAKR